MSSDIASGSLSAEPPVNGSASVNTDYEEPMKTRSTIALTKFALGSSVENIKEDKEGFKSESKHDLGNGIHKMVRLLNIFVNFRVGKWSFFFVLKL